MPDSGAMRVAGLWRYPVKSMAGEALTEMPVCGRGPVGDRLWALHDVERDNTVSGRRLPAVLRLAARYESTPTPDCGPGDAPPVIITLPDGTEISSTDPRVDAVLSAELDHEVRLMALPSDPHATRLSWRGRLAAMNPKTLIGELGIGRDESLPRITDMALGPWLKLTSHSTQPGTFVDLAPVHVLTQSSLDTIGEAIDAAAPDARRYRPNILLTGAPEGLPEAQWAPGTTLDVGAAQVAVMMKTVRCVIPSREHVGLPLEKSLTRAVASAADRYLGSYAAVSRTGVVRLDDAVTITAPRPPGRVARAAGRVREVGLDSVNRVAEMARRD